MFDDKFTPCQYQFSYYVFCYCCCFFPRLLVSDLFHSAKQMFFNHCWISILSDNHICFNQKGEKAAGVPIIPLGWFLFVVGKRNDRKSIIFMVLLDEEKIGFCLSSIFWKELILMGWQCYASIYLLIEKAILKLYCKVCSWCEFTHRLMFNKRA